VSPYVTPARKREIAHSRLQEADRVLEAYELAEKRILALQDKLGPGPQLRARLVYCRDQLANARDRQALAWLEWEGLGCSAG